MCVRVTLSPFSLDSVIFLRQNSLDTFKNNYFIKYYKSVKISAVKNVEDPFSL